MTPLDFVCFDGDSSPNMPAYIVAEALRKDIKVFTKNGEQQILGYYYSEEDECIVLDIGDE